MASAQKNRLSVVAVGLVVALGCGPVTEFASATLSPPSLGALVNVAPLNGIVIVSTPAHGPTRLIGPRQVPVGSEINVSQGVVELTAADSSGPPYSGRFSQGQFAVHQSAAGGGVTDIVLRGACARPVKDLGMVANRPLRHIYRHLSITANGKFVIIAHNAQTREVGPAKWDVNDLCDGSTRIADHQGRVVATGDGLDQRLAPGDSVARHCSPQRPPIADCELVLSTPKVNSFGFGLVVRRRQRAQYRVCLTGRQHSVACHRARLSLLSGLYAGDISCTFDSLPRGTYSSRWYAGSRPLGIPLPFTAQHAPNPFGPNNLCT